MLDAVCIVVQALLCALIALLMRCGSALLPRSIYHTANKISCCSCLFATNVQRELFCQGEWSWWLLQTIRMKLYYGGFLNKLKEQPTQNLQINGVTLWLTIILFFPCYYIHYCSYSLCYSKSHQIFKHSIKFEGMFGREIWGIKRIKGKSKVQRPTSVGVDLYLWSKVGRATRWSFSFFLLTMCVWGKTWVKASLYLGHAQQLPQAHLTQPTHHAHHTKKVCSQVTFWMQDCCVKISYLVRQQGHVTFKYKVNSEAPLQVPRFLAMGPADSRTSKRQKWRQVPGPHFSTNKQYLYPFLSVQCQEILEGMTFIM